MLPLRPRPLLTILLIILLPPADVPEHQRYRDNPEADFGGEVRGQITTDHTYLQPVTVAVIRSQRCSCSSCMQPCSPQITAGRHARGEEVCGAECEHPHHHNLTTHSQPEAEEGDEDDEGGFQAEEDEEEDGAFKKRKKREKESDTQLRAAVESMVAKVRGCVCLCVCLCGRVRVRGGGGVQRQEPLEGDWHAASPFSTAANLCSNHTHPIHTITYR